MKVIALRSDFPWGWASLLPAAAYSIRHESGSYVLGFAFARQRGVHAVGSDRRQDFDAWPGELAVTSPGVEMFSESRAGGEYLALHVGRTATGDEADAPPMPPMSPRTVFRGDRRAASLAQALRRSMLVSPTQPRLIEEQALMLLRHGMARLERPRRSRGTYDADRHAHARVLEHIEHAIDGPLGLAEMAQVAAMPVLRFMRSFTATVGSTPHAYVVDRRTQRARALLTETDRPIAEIAASCGFTHQSHLGALLKNQTGRSPREYRALAGPS